MILFRVLATTITLTIASGGKETESRSLGFFLDHHIQKSNSENPNGNDIIHLPNNIFSSCGYPVISTTLKLEGMKTELHISVERDALETETENGFDSSRRNDHLLLSIFKIRNSTVSLSSLCLNGEEHTSLIASVSSSSVIVSESDIRSNGANSPFAMLIGMMDEQSRDEGSSLHISKCRHISSSLVSLVPLAELCQKSDLAVNPAQPTSRFEETQFVEEISISASDLSICDSCLTFGTGPLIGFGSGTDMTAQRNEQTVLPWRVSSLLMKSQIMNTTSHPLKRNMNELERMELTQRVTSSSVCLSTNHLYGTACVDMNMMGSLLSLNSSFSSCLTDTPTHLGQHFTTQQELSQSTSFKLCTFKECSSASSSGAIYLSKKGSLLIEECSFQTCRTTASNSNGAVSFYSTIGTTFIAASSSFVGCSSPTGGGSLYLDNVASSTLVNCVFIDSESFSHGGCVFLLFWDAASTSSSITNCLFENCRTTAPSSGFPYSGGALYFASTITIQLNFLCFRGNTAGNNPGNDIMFAGTTPLISSETMVGCTSTSDSPRLRVYPTEEAGKDDHLPNPTLSVTLVSCEPTLIDSNTAEFTLTMSETITGTVLVLIDNSEGTRTPTNGQAPNIGRVLSFSLDDTDESLCRVSLGESGLVQEPLSDYQVITSSFVGSVVLSASCILDDSEENVSISVSGLGIPSGILSVTLSDNTVLNLTFLPQQTTSEVLIVPLTENSPKLGYGETYKIVSAQSHTLTNQHIVITSLLNLVIPNPPRLTSLNEPEYDDALQTISINLEGVNLTGTHKVTLSVNGTSDTVTIDVLFSSSKGKLGGILSDNKTPMNVNMSYNTRYKIVGMKKNEANVLCLGDLSFETMAEPTRVSIASLTHNSIHTFIRIQFSGNNFIGKYTVTLTSGFSISVTAESDTSGLSEEIALGWPDSLAFDIPFAVQSIVSANPDLNVVLNGTLKFTTPKKQDPLSLFVDGRTGETSRFCGESSRPCSSVEVAWEIVSQFGVRTPTIGIVHSATLGSQIRIENGIVALLSNLGNVEPKLRIPSAACEEVECGMIVVSSSTLEIRDVDIVIDSLSPSFVLLSARNSDLTLKDGSFVGQQSAPSSNDQTTEEICEWTSGILQLDLCNTTIIFTVLANLSFGAVNMRNGSLEVVTSSFHANLPNLSTFPSLRRNIHCSNGGHIEIGSLNGGDGVGDKMGWFSHSDCTLSGDGVDIKTSFFAPTLNNNESKTTFANKSDSFEMEIVGSVLIPCGLFLEVFEKTKDGKEGNSVPIELTLDSTQSFTEKTIKLAISQASLKKLDAKLEWRGRLVFGDSLKTVETILIQKSISERRSEATLKNMKWWLPVVIVVLCALVVVIVIVVICIRRRKNEKQTESATKPKEMEEQEDDVEKIAVDFEVEHNEALIRTTREGQRAQQNEKNEKDEADSTKKECKEDEIEAVVCDEEVKVEVVGKRETLFERLHGRNKKEVDAIVVCRALIKGLLTAGKDERLNGALLTLSPHTVVFDSSNRICLVPPSDAKPKVGMELGKEMNGSVVEGEERWRAPEQGNEKIEVGIASEQVSVFRLGLLLLEMWTGRIPFGETDGVNASRQLGMGILPPLGEMSCEMADVVRKCLSVGRGDRPRLWEVSELLDSLKHEDGRKVVGEEKKDVGLTEMLGAQSLVS